MEQSVLTKQPTTKRPKFRFEDLEIWQLSVEIAEMLFDLAYQLEAKKLFRFAEQLRGAGISMPNNIAEGSGGLSKKEFIQFLYIAEGSLFEVLTLAEIFKRRKLIKDHEAKEIRRQAEIIDRKLHGLINSLRRRL